MSRAERNAQILVYHSSIYAAVCGLDHGLFIHAYEDNTGGITMYFTSQIKSIQTAHKLECLQGDAQCRVAQKSYCSKKSEGEEKREEKK